MVLPLPAICLALFGLGVFVEMMMVQWTVTMARNIPPDKLARVSSYDVLGSVMAMPAGALIASPARHRDRSRPRAVRGGGGDRHRLRAGP